ncbi:MAG: hypothetical protein ABI581_00715 [Sediminibacterium sp.]
MSTQSPPESGSHRISVEQAKAMVIRYADNMDDILKPELEKQNILPISETFRKEAILEYFSKDFVDKIRIYYGMSEDLQIHAILVGVDKDGNDILPKTPVSSGHGHGHPHPPGGDGDEGEIFEDAVRCPSTCPPPGWPKLNSRD